MMKPDRANGTARNALARVASAAVGLALCLFFAACTTGDVVPPGLIGSGSSTAGTSLAEELSPPDEGVAQGDTAAIPQRDGGFSPVQSKPRVQFAPVVGAGSQAVAPLTQRVMQRAAERGIVIGGASDSAYVVKGYLSTLPEGGGTTLVYVWDVFDRSGARVHRIQGNETVLGTRSDAAMHAIADRTVDDLARWLSRSPVQG